MEMEAVADLTFLLMYHFSVLVPLETQQGRSELSLIYNSNLELSLIYNFNLF